MSTATDEMMFAAFDEAVTAGKVQSVGEPVFYPAGTVLSEDDLREIFTAGRPNLGSSRARGTGRSPVIRVRVPQEDKESLERYAEAHGMSVSDAMRRALGMLLASA